MTRVLLGIPDADPLLSHGWSITGLPLSEAGLDQLVVIHPDGARRPIVGVVMYPGETLVEALERTFPSCQIVYSPLEAEQLRKGLP